MYYVRLIFTIHVGGMDVDPFDLSVLAGNVCRISHCPTTAMVLHFLFFI